LLALLAFSATACNSDPGPDPPPPPVEPLLAGASDNGGVITKLTVGYYTGESLTEYMTSHPITVSMTVDPKGYYYDHTIHVGFVEKLPEGTPKIQARTCQLGTFVAPYGEAIESGTITLTNELVIPDDCLAGGADGTFNLWVSISPQLSLETDGNSVTKNNVNTQFFTAEGIDSEGEHRNAQCTGADDKPGCVVDLRITKSHGFEVRVDALEPVSSIGVLPSNCTVDMSRPLLELHDALTLFGSEPFSGNIQGEAPADGLDAAAGKTAVIDVTYAICPRAAELDDTDTSCATGTSYAPLKVGGVSSEGSGLVDSVKLDTMISGTPAKLEHDLFADPQSEACKRITGVTGAAEDWQTYGLYNLKVCAKPPFKEEGTGSKEAANNCRVVPIILVVADPVDPGAANAYSLNESFEKNLGDGRIGLNLSFSTTNTLDLSGARSETRAKADISGWFTIPLLNVWANGAAYVSLIHSGIDAGVEIGGKRVYSGTKTLDEKHWTQPNYSIGDEICATYNYGIAGLGLNLSACAKGTIGFKDASIDIEARDGNGGAPFDQSTRIGEIKAKVTPYAKFQATISAYANAVIIKGGVTGELDILNASLPATATLRWGLTGPIDKPSLVATADAALDLELSALSGNVTVSVDAVRPAWCEGGWFGYPCAEWDNVVAKTIVDWPAAWTWKTSLLNQNLGQLSLP
jgi:hypothetical protein